MPKQRPQPQTFDEFVGSAIDSKLKLRGMRQEDLAAKTGIAVTLIGRSIRGTRPISVKEFTRICGVLDFNPADVVAEVLKLYGGMDKLLADQVSEAPGTNVTPIQTKRTKPRTAAELDAILAEGKFVADELDPEATEPED